MNPENKMDARTWFTQRHDDYLTTRRSLLENIVALEAKLEEKKEEVIKSAWKWKKTVGEPLPIRKVKEEMVIAKKAVEELDQENATLIARMEDYWAWDKEEAEIELWRSGGPPPAFIQKARQEEFRQFMEECEVLPIIKTF